MPRKWSGPTSALRFAPLDGLSDWLELNSCNSDRLELQVVGGCPPGWLVGWI